MNDQLQPIVQLLDEGAHRVETNRLASQVLHFAVLSILVDAKIITIDQTCERIAAIHRLMPERYRTEEVGRSLQEVIEWLRSHERTPPPGWTPHVIEGGRDQSAREPDAPDRSS